VAGKKRQIKKFEKEISKPDFWKNPKKARRASQLFSDLKKEIEFWTGIDAEKKDLLDLALLSEKERDNKLSKEIEDRFKEMNKKFNQTEFELLMSGKHDKGNAILMIHAGTGGTEAQDWAQMLMRMYLRYIEKRSWRSKIVEKVTGQEAGIKHVTIEVRGRYAFGYLRAETGIHRLVRLSPFDSDHARHTSFALVEIFPEIEDETEVSIDPKDLKIDTFRASGAGGQHVNKTSSAVRITYLPLNLVVTCQDARSQQQNRETALKILRAKLYEKLQKEKERERETARGKHVKASWGNQIRSYVLHPYKQVRDHRTGFEVKNAEKVLDGEIDGFIESWLKQK
jgi:peptide chain release factor 2